MSRNRWKFSKSTIAVGVFALAVGLLAALTAVLAGGPATGRSMGLVEDWSTHHVVFSNPGTAADALAQGRLEQWYRTVNDPRYIMQVMKRNPEQRGLATASNFATLANQLSSPIWGPGGISKHPSPSPKQNLKKDWSVNMGGVAASQTGTVTSNGATGSSTVTVGGQTLTGSAPVAATQTGSFSSPPLTTSSPITVSYGSNVLSLTTNATPSSVTGTAAGTPLSGTTISLTTASALVLSNGGTGATATGTFAAPPLTSTPAITLTSGSNTLTMNTGATPSHATGTFAGIPTSSNTISVTSLTNTLTLSNGGTGATATGTFSAPPLSTDSYGVTSGTNTLSLHTNATASHVTGTFAGPPYANTSIGITSGSNTLTMTPNGTGATATGTFSATPLSTDSYSIKSGSNTLALKTNATASNVTGTFAAAPYTNTSIGITSGSKTLTMTTSATPSYATGTASGTPASNTTITITNPAQKLTLSNGGTGANAVGTFSGPPLAGTSISITTGTNTLTMKTGATTSSSTGTFSYPPLYNTTVTIPSGIGSSIVTLSSAGTGTVTFGSTPSTGNTITIGSTVYQFETSSSSCSSGDRCVQINGTSGTATNLVSAIGGSCFPSTGNGSCSTPDADVTAVIGSSTSTVSILNTTASSVTWSKSGINIALSPTSTIAAPSTSNDCTSATAGTFIPSTSTATLANNLAAAINACHAGAYAIGATASYTSGSTLTVTDTLPGASGSFGTSNAGSTFAWSGTTTGSNGSSNTCSGSGGVYTGTFVTSTTPGTLGDNFNTAIGVCAASVGFSTTHTTGQATVTVTETVPGDFTTFTPSTNAPSSIFSWGTVTAGTNGSNACTSSTAGTYATSNVTATLASNIYAAINACNTSYPAVGATASNLSGSAFTITDTTAGSSSTFTFTLGGSNYSGIFAWSGQTSGSNGTTNTCSGSGNTYTGTYATSSSTGTLASNFYTAISVCAAAVGFSSTNPSNDDYPYNYLTVSDTTPGSQTTSPFSVTATNNSGIFSWGTVSNGTDGSNGCTNSTTGTFATSSTTATLASNLAAAINSCNTSYPLVAATASYPGSGSSFTITDNIVGNFSTFTLTSNDTGVFSWSSVTAGTLGSNTCPSSTAGTFATASTTATLASNLSAAINSCNTSYPAVGATSSWTSSNSYFTITDTTPGTTTTSPFSGSVSNASGIFSWGSVSGGGNGSNTCSSSTSGTFATSNVLATLAGNLSSAITSCNGSYAAVGATGSYTSGNSFTVTDTTPGDFTTFSVASNDTATLSWGSGVTAGTDGSGACTSSTAGTFATASTTATLASNLAAVINACNTSYPLVGATAGYSGSGFTVTDTTPGTTGTFPFSVATNAPSGIFLWGSVSGGSNGSSNTCSGSGNAYTGTYETSSTMSTLAGYFNTAIGVCAASVGFSTGTSNNTVTVTDTTLGAGTTFSVGGGATGVFTWGGVTPGSNGSNVCTSSTAGTYGYTAVPATLAGNIAAAINACNASYPAAVTATASYSSGTSFTVTDTIPGATGTFAFTPSTNASGSIFTWGSVTGGGNGSTACTTSTAGTYATSSSTSTLATNLSAAINACLTGTGITKTSTHSGSGVTITAVTAGTGGNSIALSPTSGYFAWNAGDLTGGSDGTISGTNFAYWSVNTAATPAELAANIATAINDNTTLQASTGVTATTSGSNVITVTANTAGTAGDSIALSKSLTGFAWTAGTLAGGSGAGSVQPNMFPAKFSFSSTTADCTNDFVVYPTGSAGSASAANIVAFNNVYSGCGGTVPSAYWAYNTAGTDTGAAVTTSPILSPEGTQVAFIQSGGASGATLVLLKWGPSPTGTLTAPGSSNKGTLDYRNSGGDYRAYTSGPVYISLVFKNGNNDTYSAPFYDYSSGQDAIYVGDDSGYLHKFTGVFYGSPTEVVTCGVAPCWPVLLNASNKVTSPVYDPASGYVFVGDMGGYLYAVGTGNAGTTDGGIHGTSGDLGDVIMDGPLVDPASARVYAFITTTLSGTHNAVTQFPTSFTSGTGTSVTFGTGGTGYYLYAGTFDNVYFQATGTHANSGNLYVLGNTGVEGGATLYRIPITSSVMGTVASAVTGLNSSHYPWPSPLTEFCNNGTSDCALNTAQTATATGTDYVFFSVYRGNVTGCSDSNAHGCILSYNISTTTPTEAGSGLDVTAPGGSGLPGCWASSGIVVDNAVPSGTLAGASQIYFIGLNGNTAGAGGVATSSNCTAGAGATILATQASQSSP